MSKDQLRKQLRKKRSAISPHQHLEDAIAATKILAASQILDNHQHIACYHSSGDEFKTKPLIEWLWEVGKKCYLPVLSSSDTSLLHFAEYRPNDVLKPNRYRILEPDHEHLFPAEDLDVVFLPLLGFDLQGHRLGSGGGYYDKTFAFLLSAEIKKPLLIGLGFQQQQIQELPHDNWDVPLDNALTQLHLSPCGRGRREAPGEGE